MFQVCDDIVLDSDEEDDDPDGSLAMLRAFQRVPDGGVMTGNPAGIDDTLTRGGDDRDVARDDSVVVEEFRNSTPDAGKQSRVPSQRHHRVTFRTIGDKHVDAETSDTRLEGAVVSGGQVTFNIDDLAKVIMASKTDAAEIVKQLEHHSNAKRKLENSEDDPDEEPPVLVDDTFVVKDNAHDLLSWPVRLQLRHINMDPKTVWSKETYPKVEHPILGESLYFEHLLPGEINASTLKLRHDRSYVLSVNQFIPRNSTILRRSSKKLNMTRKIGSSGSNNMVIETNKHWEPCKSVFEVVTGLLNYVAAEHVIRPYSYEALTILRVLHELRWLSGVSKPGFSQKSALEDLIQHLWHQNTVRGHTQQAPLTFAEAKRKALDHLGHSVERRIGHEEQGDPYTGPKMEELSTLRKELKDAKLRIKQLETSSMRRQQSREDNSRFSGARREANRDKLTDICKDFNDRKDGCKANNCQKRHACSRRIRGNYFCFNPNHGEWDHK